MTKMKVSPEEKRKKIDKFLKKHEGCKVGVLWNGGQMYGLKICGTAFKTYHLYDNIVLKCITCDKVKYIKDYKPLKPVTKNEWLDLFFKNLKKWLMEGDINGFYRVECKSKNKSWDDLKWYSIPDNYLSIRIKNRPDTEIRMPDLKD